MLEWRPLVPSATIRSIKMYETANSKSRNTVQMKKLTLVNKVFGLNWENGPFLSERSLRPLSEALKILSTFGSGFKTEHAKTVASLGGKVQTCILESSDTWTSRGTTTLWVTDMFLQVAQSLKGIFLLLPFSVKDFDNWSRNND
jgi:hypothetical protein